MGFKEISAGKWRGREENHCLPPLNYYNLQEIQAAEHGHFFQLIDGVASVMQQHAASSYLHSLAGMRNRGRSVNKEKRRNLHDQLKISRAVKWLNHKFITLILNQY